MLRNLISEKATEHASKNWNILERANEHDNAHDDFIAGASWLSRTFLEEAIQLLLRGQKTAEGSLALDIENFLKKVRN